MSNYKTTIKIKATGEIKDAWALDNHFGHHQYGYETIETDNDMSRVYREDEVEIVDKVDPVVEANISLLRGRSQIGIKKYGTTLHDNLTDDFIRHALEEVLDLANYLQAHLMRKPSK